MRIMKGCFEIESIRVKIALVVVSAFFCATVCLVVIDIFISIECFSLPYHLNSLSGQIR